MNIKSKTREATYKSKEFFNEYKDDFLSTIVILIKKYFLIKTKSNYECY